jgi:hypothetical protein
MKGPRPEGHRSLGRPGISSEDNIKKDVKEAMKGC